jgi:hypothetical protein
MSADADPWPEATVVDTAGTVDEATAAALAAVRSSRRSPHWTVVDL